MAPLSSFLPVWGGCRVVSGFSINVPSGWHLRNPPSAPPKTITGGPWYTDQQFDYEFVRHLSNYVLSYVKEKVYRARSSMYGGVVSVQYRPRCQQTRNLHGAFSRPWVFGRRTR